MQPITENNVSDPVKNASKYSAYNILVQGRSIGRYNDVDFWLQLSQKLS